MPNADFQMHIKTKPMMRLVWAMPFLVLLSLVSPKAWAVDISSPIPAGDYYMLPPYPSGPWTLSDDISSATVTLADYYHYTGMHPGEPDVYRCEVRFKVVSGDEQYPAYLLSRWAASDNNFYTELYASVNSSTNLWLTGSVGTVSNVSAEQMSFPFTQSFSLLNNFTSQLSGSSITVSISAAEMLAVATPAFVENCISPTTEFAENETEIRQVLTETAQRSLSATLGANRRMIEEALDRFIDARRDLGEDGAGVVGRTNVPFDIGGVLRVDGTMLSTRGDFFAQQGSLDGSSRRLFFGDFDLQHDGDNDSTTATLTARVAWEWMQSNRTMFGYFVGGELAYSDLEGPFTGDQERVGATIGLYAVHALDEQVYLDGFLTFGAGRNNLEMANDVLELESDYTTRTATIGAALSGVYEYGSYEFRPELAFSYGYTWIGNVGFTGRAYGLVDDTLSLDAGDVSIANLTLRPEVIWALDGLNVAESNSRFSFAPRLICERVEAGTVRQDCGGGAEFGLSSMSSDGLTEFNVRLLADRVGSSTRTGLELGIQHRF